MDEQQRLARRFEQNRTHLRAVAHRILGSLTEAEDAVQEAWLRLSRSELEDVENLGGWLTTVVARICLDMLRSRKSRREELVEEDPEPPSGPAATDPERETLLADSIGPALLVVLETLGPAERLSFVLHDMFGVSFDEIAPIVGRSATAARQLASRGRRRVQGAPTVSDPDRGRQRELVRAFLAAARGGNFEALLSVLDPDVVVRADDGAVALGARSEVRGADAAVKSFSGRSHAARLALVDGVPGVVWAPGGRPRVVVTFKLADEKITEIYLRGDSAHVGKVDLVMLES